MKPSVIFLNGPEDDRKRTLVSAVRKKFQDNACVAINRKELLNMFNAHDTEQDESFEWIVAKVLKNLVNNGVFILFDAFLPSRRMQQYVQQMNGLPCYWIGVFFGEHDTQFYDYTVQIKSSKVGSSDLEDAAFLKEIAEGRMGGIIQTTCDNDIETAAQEIFEYVFENEPKCFESFRSVEFPARKRVIVDSERYVRPVEIVPKARPVFETAQEKRAYKERKFRSLKDKYQKDAYKKGEKMEDYENHQDSKNEYENCEANCEVNEENSESKPGFLKSLFGSRIKDAAEENVQNHRKFYKDAWKNDPNLSKKREAFNEFAKQYKPGDEFFKGELSADESGENSTENRESSVREGREDSDRSRSFEKKRFGNKGGRRPIEGRSSNTRGSTERASEGRRFGGDRKFGEKSFGDFSPRSEVGERGFSDRSSKEGAERNFGERPRTFRQGLSRPGGNRFGKSGPSKFGRRLGGAGGLSSFSSRPASKRTKRKD